VISDKIRTVDGKARVLLKSGKDVPLSRGYREGFEAVIS